MATNALHAKGPLECHDVQVEHIPIKPCKRGPLFIDQDVLVRPCRKRESRTHELRPYALDLFGTRSVEFQREEESGKGVVGLMDRDVSRAEGVNYCRTAKAHTNFPNTIVSDKSSVSEHALRENLNLVSPRDILAVK